MFRILIAEDDAQLRHLFTRVLLKSGYDVTGVDDGEAALDALDKAQYDLLITDLMMPNLDGVSLIRMLRDADMAIPVLVVTAKDAFEDMSRSFTGGADDYMVKPVNVNELVLRVAALLRRAKIISERRVTVDSTVIEYDSFTVSSGTKRLELPQKEFQLLFKLASSPGRIFTKQQLMDEIWGYDTTTDAHTVEVHVGRLRERLADFPDLKIGTVRGVGYKLEKRK